MGRTLYLVPNLFGTPNGIAKYCQMVLQSLLDEETEVHVVALHDLPDAADPLPIAPGAPPSTGRAMASYRGCAGARLRFIRESVTATLRSRPRLVLVGHPNFAPLGWVVALLARAPYVVFAYGTDIWDPISTARRWATCRAARMITISRFTAQGAVRANGVDPRRTRILFNCLDPKFLPRERAAPRPTVPSMLTVARMARIEQYKGHDYVIRALPALLRQFPDLVYHVVGGGDWRPDLEELARQEGVYEAIRFHGMVSDEELARLYGETSVFVMPSRCEGFGFVFLEAMAQGTPAIGGNMDASPEVIVDGETGYVVDPTSSAAIAGAIARVLADPDLRERMGRAGVERAVTEFSYARFHERLGEYLAEVSTQPR
jgi:glycosyltransferase involved in cell wall biosynthesis